MAKKRTVRVLQVDIGDGILKTVEHDIGYFNAVSNALQNYFKPSVRAWAARNGYDYQCITEYSGHGFFPVDKVDGAGRNYALDRYIHFRGDHDITVYFDLDVYITKIAPPVPEIEGVMAVDVSRDYVKTRQSFVKYHPEFPNDLRYVNSGVVMTDRPGGCHLADYFADRIEKKTYPKGLQMDESMFNEYFNSFPEKVGYLDPRWNFCPGLNSGGDEQPFAIHHATYNSKKAMLMVFGKKCENG